jgi:hypothetical protein
MGTCTRILTSLEMIEDMISATHEHMGVISGHLYYRSCDMIHRLPVASPGVLCRAEYLQTANIFKAHDSCDELIKKFDYHT